MKTINKTQQGFTLVELIIVIVILGILAVTAAPRFLNFTSDARAAVLNSAAGAIKAGNSLIYGKGAIAGLNGAALSCFSPTAQTVVAAASTEITANTAETTAPSTKCVAAANTIDVKFGYLDADRAAFLAALDVADFFIADATVPTTAYTVAVAAGTVRIAGSAADLNPAVAGTGCYLTYTESTAINTEPTVVVVDNACN